MADAEVRVLGYPELAAGSAILAKRIDEAANQEFKRVADRVARQVSGRVPRRTGRLVGSVHAALKQDGASVTMGEGVPYAGFVEYGGRGHPHSPQGNYLYPAALEAEPLLVDAAERAATEEIGAMSWPTPT